MKPIVAFGILNESKGGTIVRVVALNKGANPDYVAEQLLQAGADIVVGLSRLMTGKELASFVPIAIQCPYVVSIYVNELYARAMISANKQYD